MSFMDRIRETATDVVASASDGLAKGQAKIDEAQARSAGNDLFRTLGQAWWVHSEGRADDGRLAGLIEVLRPQIAALEAKLGPAPWPVADPVAPAGPGPGDPPTDTPPGAPSAPDTKV